ncbi:long chain acyl-CoA synthetase 4 isoform X1 [Zea mays]|uniref:Long-chain-fatty-acid--CoA ligase n=2 Tax=Zea mays TaxID=4577 RepID=A0A096PQY2_MAIZE|nr:long chain acyl-CoA synthetase 4 isoform X1 [Zea mays]ONM39682.1 Long chain acyl-CoA synthetase 5 [Zea mays]|eukprot:XP_008652385.1 long chain acyl-CoA synthetase 4 isoform X1 [Zea mays]
MQNVVEVEPGRPAADGRPSVGPTYRSAFARDGFPPPVPGMDSCYDIFRMAVEKYPNNRMLGHREIVDGKAGAYTWKTYKEVFDIANKIGNSIRSCGLAKGSRCGIYGANCPEWIITMEACNAHGIYCVPLYDTLGAGAVEFILCHAEVEIAFAEEKKIDLLVKTLPKSNEFLKTIISFGKVTQEQKGEVQKYGLSIYSWDEFLSLAADQEFDLPVKEKADICTIMYTSGTTGDPKGVLISNASIICLIAGVDRLLNYVNEELAESDVYMSYLPLAHIFDRVVEELFIFHGASIGFWQGDVKLLVEDIGVLKPTIMCAVPRVLDRIFSGLQAKISSGGFLKSTVFNLAYRFKQFRMMSGAKHNEAASICDKVVFSKVKEGLGGNVRVILSGAAPLATHVEEYLRVVTCAHVVQGYGLTETCAGSFVSLPNQMSMIGTVGPPVPNIDVRLESVPEMGYDALASKPRGEICIRGETLFSGYYKREDLTKEVLIDGWFHTGDIGEWQPDGSMKIIDRKKNIFKLSQGEYVAVENLENVYGLVSAIDSIWIYGNSFESFLVAVVNPNKEVLESWAAANGISGDFESLCNNPRTKEYILGELSRIGKEKRLKGFEFVKDVHLEPVPFDMDRDLITPTYKKKRPQLLKYYQGVIDNMYKSAK